MEFFSLGKWLDNLCGTTKEDLYTKLMYAKPVFERLYGNEINVFQNGTYVFDAMPLNIDTVVEWTLNNVSLYKFLDDCIVNGERPYSNLDRNIIYDLVNESGKRNENEKNFRKFTKEIIHSAIVRTYIELSYQKDEKKMTVYKMAAGKDYSYFLKKTKDMQYFTVLGRIMGVTDNELELGKEASKTRYLLPSFQSQLIKNLINTLKFSFFFRDKDMVLAENTKRGYQKNRIPSENYLNKLFDGLSRSYSGGICSFYIIEQLFNFNLSYIITDNIMKRDMSISYRDIISRLSLLFRFPNVKGRVDCFEAFMAYRDRLIKTAIENKRKERIISIDEKSQAVSLTKEEKYNLDNYWITQSENFSNYLYRYFIPQVEFIFLCLYEELRRRTNDDDVLLKLLEAYINHNCPYAQNSADYLSKIFSNEKIEAIKNVEQRKNCKDILEHIIDYTVMDIFYVDTTHFDKNAVEEFLVNKGELEEDATRFELGIDMFFREQEYLRRNKELIDDKINKLINDRNPFRDYSKIREVLNSCAVSCTTLIIEELLKHR